ncbi:MAG TPA: methyl-accepting chemotaxis protein [Anaeromyxobacter sp.]|nr:methyl-accepting chemotaxis protein [Anaeromyxobacter sp.]
MKIANRLKFSSVTMLTATLAIAGVAVLLQNSATSSVSSTQQYFETDHVLEEMGDQARAYVHGASEIAATGAVTENDLGRLKVVEDELRARVKKLEGADAVTAGKAVDALVEQTATVLQETAAAAQSAKSGTKRVRVPRAQPAPAKLLPKKAKGAKALPPPTEPPPPEDPVIDAAAEAEAELESAQTQLAAKEAGLSATGRLGQIHRDFSAAISEIVHGAQKDLKERLGGAESRAKFLLFLLIALVAGALGFVFFMFRGFRSELLRPLELLAQGARRVSTERDLTVRVPVSGDEEIKDLGRAFGEMMETLRGITIEMRGATDRLLSSATELGGITRAQGESIARQASALEEARRTSSALRESSRETVGQAEGVLRVAQKAEALGRDGESAMTENLSSAEVIQDQTRQVVDRIARLATSAQRIAAITATVKDLADQSNVVALNAAIEASRAGEAGVGFGVVAREIRSLADRSIRATIEVRTVLAEVLNGIKESASLVEAAHAGLEEGTSRTRRLGESVAGLTGIVRENLSAVREISGAVASQGTGIGQISNAVEDLSLMMEDTLKTVHTTGEAAGVLREVSEQVSSAVKVFRL